MVKHETIINDMGTLQGELRKWGWARRVTFDAGKEHKLILNRKKPCGESFKLLGYAS